MKLSERLQAWQEAGKRFVSGWWRPITCVGIAASVWVNGVILPLWKGVPADGVGLAAIIAAATTAFAVRELGKKWGTAQ